MAGIILENFSGQKLSYLISIILLCQVVCFLIGGLLAPAPSGVDTILATRCLMDRPLGLHELDDVWHIPRGNNGKKNINCKIHEMDTSTILNDPAITPNHFVFAFQVPLPRDGIILDYSRWMAPLNAVLLLDIAYNQRNPMAKEPKITFKVKLGYRSRWDPEDKWTLIANSTETRDLHCTIDNEKKIEGFHYECNLLPLFELASLYHDYYLVNLHLPTDPSGVNNGIGHVDDMWMVVISQNENFTKIWILLKIAFFPVLLTILIWFWIRICVLCRPSILIEKSLFALGISLSLLNLPLEYLTLWMDMPYMILLRDIKQGIFYACLLSFWLVFCGEHLMDEFEGNHSRNYWQYFTSVGIGCFCLIIFDVCKRVIPLQNPFFSIWNSTIGANLSLGFIILIGFSACLYFLFFSYFIYKVYKNIDFKRNILSNLNSARQMYYKGIIYRFKFLMMTTVICAALTVIYFIVEQIYEGHLKWHENMRVEYTSAFFTGVYGMWNLYAIALLILYAPSHKSYSAQSGDGIHDLIDGDAVVSNEKQPVTLMHFLQSKCIAKANSSQ